MPSHCQDQKESTNNQVQLFSKCVKREFAGSWSLGSSRPIRCQKEKAHSSRTPSDPANQPRSHCDMQARHRHYQSHGGRGVVLQQ